MSPLDGLPFVVDPKFVQEERRQVRFPRSKRRRIRKKWSRDSQNFTTVQHPIAFVMLGVVYLHPTLYQQLLKSCGLNGEGVIHNNRVIPPWRVSRPE